MSLNKLGRYDIIRVLGKGAMGLVYEARDPNLERRVAIKTIKVENLSEEAAAEYEARFRTEARSAARLQHPNIVSVYDSDRDGDMAYLVMEFIQGEDLKQHLDGGKRYSLAQSLAMVADLLAALDYAHRQNIVHRDVKPANLLIEANGRVKLTDFGVARIQDSGEATRTQGTMVGTLKYMSPEQVQGVPIDSRSDLFAVGVVLYQLLTGKRPFDGDTDFAIIQQIVGHTPAAPSTFSSSLPASIDAVVARALAKKREQRFASAQDFAAALQLASGQALDPTVVPPVSQPGRRAGNATDTGLQRSRVGGSTVRLRTGGTDIGSTVTQELELVYWKDIKDSDDTEDLAGFLDKFPSGIYADLARRRLRKLGGAGLADGSGTGCEATTLVASPSEISEWTRLQVQHTQAPLTTSPAADQPSVSTTLVPADASAAAAPLLGNGAALGTSALSADPVRPPAVASRMGAAQSNPPKSAAEGPAVAKPAPVQLPAGTAAKTASPTGRRLKTPALALAGVALLVLAVVAFKGLSGPTVPPIAVLPDAPAAAPGSAAVPAADAARPSRAAAAVPASAIAAASAAKPVAKRVAPPPTEKPAVTKPVPVKPGSGEGFAGPAPKLVPEAAASPAASFNPRQACDNRVFLGFQSCMNEQCAKPAFSRHPACVERSNQEKLRREAQEQRN
jgi:serine/threonine-protein kinase